MTPLKKALITGITGQDGAYLAQLLLGKQYQVTGTYRRTSSVNFWRIEELGIATDAQLQLVECDLTDLSSMTRLIQRVQPDEIYHLAAQSFVGEPDGLFGASGILFNHESPLRGREFVTRKSHAHSLGQVLDLMAEIAGYRIEVDVNPAFVRANEVLRLVGDNRRLASVIGAHGGLTPVPLADTLRWMFQA